MLPICSRIAVPYDHSDLSKKALDMAINLSHTDEKIELYVLMVINPVPAFGYPYGFSLDEQDSLLESRREAMEPIIKEVKDKLEALPNRTSTFVLDGDPGKVIVEFVKENAADLIVMGSRGLGGLKEMFLGSVSHHVVQKAHCPVMIVK